MAAARMAFASSCRVHLLLPSSPSTPILARPRVGFRGIAKSISFLAPLSAARSAALFCSCSSPSSDAVVAPVPTQAAVEEKKPAPAVGEEEKGEVPVGELAGLLDIRVGRVVKAWLHPEADTLYVEEVDVGEEQPRTICSGLVKYLPLDQLQDSNVIVLANLKPRNMRGIKSSGMLMCASDASHETVELLTPPEGSVPGERVWFGSEDEKSIQSEPATGNQVQKKKIWESVQPHLKTTDNCVAVLGEQPMRTSAGMVFCKSLQGASVS
ncbi:hypothetical protein CFC21_023493 [Triticum aestivum]|uniref:tRNA-binding domain-containing protein n=3 Tax=Triticum aestivum TaxID=4565 RepID=A0A9R1EET5_WHEAT|nr:hypothetical protein CFC21_023493 [Triticum aestivum]